MNTPTLRPYVACLLMLPVACLALRSAASAAAGPAPAAAADAAVQRVIAEALKPSPLESNL